MSNRRQLTKRERDVIITIRLVVALTGLVSAIAFLASVV